MLDDTYLPPMQKFCCCRRRILFLLQSFWRISMQTQGGLWSTKPAAEELIMPFLLICPPPIWQPASQFITISHFQCSAVTFPFQHYHHHFMLQRLCFNCNENLHFQAFNISTFHKVTMCKEFIKYIWEFEICGNKSDVIVMMMCASQCKKGVSTFIPICSAVLSQLP